MANLKNTIEAYIVNLDVSFLGENICPSKLMWRGRASALKNYALTYKCQNINFFKYSRIKHQKKRLEPLMNEQNSGMQNIENCGRNGQKTFKNPTFCHFDLFFLQFFGHNFRNVQYFEKRIFARSSVVKGTSFDV